MEKRYKAKEVEEKWVKKWEEMEVYRFDENDSKRPIYSIDSPPPYTSGALHMGHVLSYSYFDFVARYKRMKGYNVFYPQGWDTQGFPTEVKVEKKYGKLPREEFVKRCKEWTEEFIAKMKEQMKRLGFSPDWRFEYRTMDPWYHKAVQYSLLLMHQKGLVYMGEHPVFWCPRCQSAIAKAETEEMEREGYLYYIKFPLKRGGFIEIATTRPELLHGVAAIFVNPEDERYKHLIGEKVIVPIFGQEVEIMTCEDVEMEFGTGAVMVSTFGDSIDVKWAYRYGLKITKTLNERGELINASHFSGLTVEKGREEIARELERRGLLVKKEKIKQVVKVHDRCKHPIEFIMSKQWFLKLKDHRDMIIETAKKMRWVPEFTIAHLIDWARNLEWDWVISRDRVWGTPIPFWYCEECHEIIPARIEDLPVDPALQKAPVEKCPRCGSTRIKGEEKVLDCWIDSSITPLTMAFWPIRQDLIKKVYPADLRPQGTEIIRTWAFYTIYRCKILTGEKPFKTLLLNGNVLGPDGRKMSKSLGNVVEPDELLLKYSADAIRQWAAMSGCLARDRPFQYKDIKYAQTFLNKLWNASRFIWMNTRDFDPNIEKEKVKFRMIDLGVLSKINRLAGEIDELYEHFDFFSVITKLHDFFWHHFCDFYLEEIKHRLYEPEKYGKESKIAAQFTIWHTLRIFIKLLAPIAPFITEELYHIFFKEYEGAKSVHVSEFPKPDKYFISESAEKAWELANAIIRQIRKFKAERRMPLNQKVSEVRVCLPKDLIGLFEEVKEDIKATMKVGTIILCQEPQKDSVETELKGVFVSVVA